MTSTTAFTALSVPAPDENMEMSSPALNNLDDDIEIDFDDYPASVPLTDDERMLEDVDPTRPATAATDDLMEDDIVPHEQTIAEEQIMQDDGLQIPPLHQEDEELIDYGEDEIHEVHQDDALLPSAVQEAGQLPEIGTAQADGELMHAADLAIPEVPVLDLADELTSETLRELPPDSEDVFGSVGNLEEDSHVDTAHAVVSGTTADEPEEVATLENAGQAASEYDTSQAPASITTSMVPQVDTPGTPTDTGLHPMMIRYGDLRMPLFKSRRQPDGLLKDDNLASLSLAELIKNCRQRLAIKIGEDVSEDQELHLAFDHLGLILVEDSRAAFENSLNDILEVYLQLHHNDGVQDCPPLSLSLSLQLKFASSLSVLKQAATGGQGLSSFGYSQPVADEDYYYDEFENGDTTEQFGDEHDEPADGERVQIAGQDDQPEDYDETQHTGEEGAEYEHEDYYQEQEDYNEEAYPDENNLDQAPPGLEDLLQGEHQLTDSINDTLVDTAATGQEEASQDAALHLEAALGTANDADSRATSTTVQGDNVANNVGEYEDLIDWDDDTLTSDESAGTSHDPDEFARFLTEFDDENGRVTAKDGEPTGENPDGAHNAFEPQAEQYDDHPFDGQHFHSEDFLNDHGENQYEGQEEYEEVEDQEYEGEEEQYAPGEEEGIQDDGEEDNDEADTYGEQQDEYHPDYAPGEGEEQFHTAQDFLNGEDYEHPLEHEHEDDGAEAGLDDTLGTVVHHPIGDYDDDEAQEEFGDDLRFDDETFEPEPQHEQQQSDGNALKRARSGSPLGKRSFDEHADEDDLEIDEPEAKKSRAS